MVINEILIFFNILLASGKVNYHDNVDLHMKVGTGPLNPEKNYTIMMVICHA